MKKLLVALIALAGIVAGQSVFPPSGGGGGSGTITSIATGCGTSGGTITTTGTIIATETVNVQTGTTYAILTGDCGKLVTGSNAAAQAYSIAQAGSAGFPAGWYVDIENRGAGTLTITPATSTIDGAATLALTTNQGVRLTNVGGQYYTGLRGTGSPVVLPGIDNATLSEHPVGTIAPLYWTVSGPASTVKTWTIPNQSIDWTALTGITLLTAGVPSIASTTGSGAVVLANTPTLITPNIGAATGSSLTVTGAITTGNGSGIGGALDLAQGTLAALGTNTVSFVAPTSVTSYEIVMPGIAADGIPHRSNSSNVVTETVSLIVNADITNATIDLTAKVTGVLPNANTTATSANTASAIVARDGSGVVNVSTLATVTLTVSGNSTFSGLVYNSQTTKANYIMNANGSNYGYMGNLAGSSTFALGYASTNNGTLGTSALTWNDSGLVVIPGTFKSAAYQSADGSAGVTVSACTSFKNGLCVAGT